MRATWRILQHPCGRVGTGMGLLVGLMLAIRGGGGRLLFFLGALTFWLHMMHLKIHR
jgi:hypothetical protein